MNIKTFYLRIAKRNVQNYWRQSLAAIISIIAGFTAFALFDGYLLEIYRAYSDFNKKLQMYGDVIIERAGASEIEGRSDPWTFALSKIDQQLIQEFLIQKKQHIQAASRFLVINGTIDTSESSAVFQGLGYDINEAARLREQWSWDTYWGRPLQRSSPAELQMILGMRLARKLGCLPDRTENLGDYLTDLEKHPQERPFLCANTEFQISAMTEQGQVNALDLTVSGIQDKGFVDYDSRHLVMSLPTALKLFNTDKVSYFAVSLKDKRNVDVVVTAFNNSMKKTKAPLTMTPLQRHPFGDLYRKSISLLNVIRNFLTSIIVLIGSLSVFNTLVKTVRERTREIGMLRSLGFQPNQIRNLFITETLLLGSIGCLIGALLSLGLSIILNSLGLTYPSGQFSFEAPFYIQIQPSSYIKGFLLMSLVSLIACWLAVNRSSKEDVATLLLHH